MISLFLLHALYGTSAPFNKLLLQWTPPLFLAGMRLVIGSFILLYLSKYYRVLHCKQSNFFPSLVFGLYGKYVLKFISLSYLSVTTTVLMISFTPLLSALFFQNISKKQWGALCIGFLGLCLVLNPSYRVPTALWGKLLLIGAMICHLYVQSITQRYIRTYSLSPSYFSAYHSFVAGFLILLTSFVCEGSTALFEKSCFVGYFTIAILINNVICHAWYIHLLKHYSITFMALADYIGVIASIVYSVLFLKESLPMTSYYGAFLIFLGLLLFYKEEALFNVTLL